MGDFKAQNKLLSVEESSQFQNASDIEQEITIHATNDTDVTLQNPHIVENGDSSEATIAVKLAEMDTFVNHYFAAGQEKVMKVASIGSTSRGSTGTKVIIRGVK
jgi:hypothetical protein